MPRRPRQPTEVVAFTHPDDARRNIPSAEMEPVMDSADRKPIHLAYVRRNRDLDPQLVWRGKDEQDIHDLVVPAPPLFIQEKLHPKVLIDGLMRLSKEEAQPEEYQVDLFSDFNGLHDPDARTEFYQHEQNWSNRMILGDSLQVMASLSDREGLRGKVQCIYIDPPYGIRFNSNFQWSTTSRTVRDGNVNHITREPEQVRAFRDTWKDGIHSYLSYLRDRLTVARDLLTESGSIFVQIGDENVHRVRTLLDEVFGENNFLIEIKFRTTSNRTSEFLPSIFDSIIAYAKDRENCKFHHLYLPKKYADVSDDSYGCIEFNEFEWRRLSRAEKDNPNAAERKGALFGLSDLTSSHEYIRNAFDYHGKLYDPKRRYWSTSIDGLNRLARANRLCAVRDTLRYKRLFYDTPIRPLTNMWTDTSSGSRTEDRVYVVQTLSKVIQRCILMTTDPGDLVLDPTCGAGTTAYVAEQWGRRWITIDTSRVALALARARIMGACYPYYLLADSPEGQLKEAELRRRDPPVSATYGNIRQGFVNNRVSHITLRDIANNSEIDLIWDDFQKTLEPLRSKLNETVGEHWEEWEIPRDADDAWGDAAKKMHADWWKARIARQKEVDASIAAAANFEYLHDQPFQDNRKVRVSGPFTVESLSPHRVIAADDRQSAVAETGEGYVFDGEVPEHDFAGMILDNLRSSGVQQSQKADKIDFTSIIGWPGKYICAEGRYMESNAQRRAGIFIGPEFGTVSRPDLIAAAREAADAGCDALIACAFSYDAHATNLDRLGALPVLKARMNADLHMAGDLKNDSKGNLFVIFGEPDIEVMDADEDMLRIKINGVDIYHPATGQVRSDDTDGIACWFIDTDYNEESFFVRHAYFLGAGDPYKALKTTLKAEIDAHAWNTLNSDTSRPFPRPSSGRIAVKVINHLGDEVMKVLTV